MNKDQDKELEKLVKMWKSPKLINTDAIDKIPPDLIERLLKL
jgi:hypothetical protein